jgi:hypothetical protein
MEGTGMTVIALGQTQHATAQAFRSVNRPDDFSEGDAFGQSP